MVFMTNKIKTFFAITIVIFVTIVLHYAGWIAPIENFIKRIINPTSGLIYSLSVSAGDSMEKFDSVEELQSAYADLKEQHASQQIDQVRFQMLKDENQELRKQLGFFTSSTDERAVASVIGRNIDTLGSTILIDKGSDNGVEVGNPVVAGAGAMIGVVVIADNRTAIVRLINDNQSKVAATIMNKDKSIGLVEGGFGIGVQMNFIPQNEQINIGDIITTSGLTRNIPRGLIIGVVEAIEQEAYQPFQRAIISPTADLDSLILVSVIIPT